MTAPAAPPSPPLRPLQALAVFLVAVTTFLAIGPLTAPLGLWGLIIAHLTTILAVPLLVTRLVAAPLLPTFGLRPPRRLAIAGAAAIGVSFWYVNAVLVAPLAERLAAPGEMEALTQTLVAPEIPLALTVIAAAIVPAFSEELLMRGLLLRAFLPWLGRAGTIGATAILFGILHLSLARGLTTAVFGLLLADVAIASGSVVPTIAIHGLNNTMAILAATGALEWLLQAHTAHPYLVASLACLMTAGGLVVIHVAGATVPRRGVPSSV